MLIRRITTTLLVLYIAASLYTVLAAISGIGFFPFLTPIDTLLAFGFAVLHSSQNLGWKRGLLLLGCTFAVSLVFESVGVATGWVYGSYHYTDKLGVKFLGLVPLLIPLAWFMMSYPSLVIIQRLVPKNLGGWSWRLVTAGLGAVVMTAWDLTMDPMMVLSGHWVWDQPGAFFGIPIHNYIGWWLTIFIAFMLYFTLAKIKPAEPASSQSSFQRQAILSYTVTGLTSLVVGFQTGLPGPALAGLFAMLPWILLGWFAQDLPSATSQQPT